MSRLPNPGADQGVWGDILNDFLLEEHQTNGTLKIRTDGTFESAITGGGTGQYWRGDKTWQTLSKQAVGLDQVDNTSDANKPVSNAAQSALDANASDSAVVHKTGDTLTGDLAFASGVSATFNGPQQYLRWDPGEGLWLAVADNNKNLKISYGGGSGRMVIDQYGFGEVARFSNGTLSMRGHVIKEVADPEEAQDAATKAYVDAGILAVTTKSTNYSATGVDHTILVNANAGSVVITLPSAVLLTGKTFTIKKIDGSGNSVTAMPSSGQTIDGGVDFLLPAAWRYITVQSDGLNWFIISNN